jgi:hypothetical protein
VETSSNQDHMTPSPMSLLSDTGEQETVEEISSDTLKKLAETPASELSVRLFHRNCWAKRWIRRFRMWMMFVFGAAMVVQVGGAIAVNLALRNLDARTAETVRATVEKVLRDHKIVAQEPNSFRDFLAAGEP